MAAVFGAKSVLHPCGQTGSLIVEEDATELNSGFPIGVGTSDDIGIVVLGYGSIGPPVPGRHAQLAAQLVDAVDGASTVAAGNDHLITDGGDDEFLTLAFQVGKFQPVNLLIFSQRANQNGRIGCRFGRKTAKHTLHIGLQVADGHLHPFILLLAVANGGVNQ